jgi:transcriptional regulator with XRE-family HTH domain
LQLQTQPDGRSATRAHVANEEVLFRRRLRELVIEKYGSLDRFYLETDFSKGHLSQILRGKRSPSLATIVKLARALDVSVADFFNTQKKS